MKWTIAEIEIIKNNYESMTDGELQRLLPNRTEKLKQALHVKEKIWV